MKLTKQTIEVLQNFISINPSIIIDAGRDLSTMSEARNMIANAALAEDQAFPMDLAIYDLSEFLAAVSIADDPELSFTDKYINISGNGGRTKVRYYLTDREMLQKPAKVNMPSNEVRFTLDKSTIDKLIKAAGVFGHTEILITSKDGQVQLSVADKEDNTANTFSIEVAGEVQHDEFTFVMAIANLKRLAEGTYTVSVSSKMISEFVNQDRPVKYWIALEKTSKYGV